MAAVKTEAQYKQYFSGSFKGMDSIIYDVLFPIFDTFTPTTSPKGNDYVSIYGNGGANIDHIYDYGTFYTDETNVSVFEVILADNCHISIARKNIQNTVRQITKTYSGAFIVFHYPDKSSNAEAQTWRLSWLKRLDVHREDSPAKRYTYLCGPSYSCRTIAKRFDVLYNEPNKTLDAITAAFDVEALSKDFFYEYKVFYDDIIQWITGTRYVGEKKSERIPDLVKSPKDLYTSFAEKCKEVNIKEWKSLEDKQKNEKIEKFIRDWVKKLMGRLVFIQFIQKKGWLGIKDNVSDWKGGEENFLLNRFVYCCSGGNNFLKNELYDILFDSLNKSEHKDDGGVEITKRGGFKYPFLNGGLFEEEPADSLHIELPNEFFHTEGKKDISRSIGKKGYRKKENEFFEYCGLLDFFGHYNFTIDENALEDEESEVGIDPEMLSKVFENLLEDNKEKGAFYTPKEIVQYMCKESLISYLCTEIKGIDNEIRSFVETQSIDKNLQNQKEEILNALHKVKICDPAVGSGAFPMGLLNLILKLRLVLNDDMVCTDKGYDYANLMSKIKNAESDNNEDGCKQEKTQLARIKCAIKKHIIQNNIYGVDIEKGAVDLARLRFWLNIVVDEDKPTPLPNLDFKIMQGNSLLEQFEGIDLSRIYDKPKYGEQTKIEFDPENKAKGELWRNMTNYFSVTDHENKAQLRKYIAGSVCELILAKTTKDEIRDKISNLDITSNDQFFLWHTWFADVFEKGGFDIVIGNPPYFVLKNDVAFKNIYDKIYKEIKSGRMNIYQIFFGLAGRITNNKGVVSFIHPKTLLSDSYLSATRKYLLEQFWKITILNIVNRHDVFENVLQAVIISLWQKSEKKYCRVSEIQKKEDLSETLYIKPSFDQFVSSENKIVVSGNNIVYDIIKKVSKLKDAKFNFGTGSYEWNKLKGFLSDTQSHNSCRLIYGENIQRFAFSESKKRIGMTFITGVDVECLSDCAIITQRTTSSEQEWRIFATIITPNDFDCKICTENGTNVFMVQDIEKAKFYLGILNSKFIDFYFRIFNSNTHVSSGELNDLPIPFTPKKQKEQSIIISLVDRILSAKKDNSLADTTFLERKIDVLVYLLYGLTWDEVQIVENSLPQTEEEDEPEDTKNNDKEKVQLTPMPKLNIDESTYSAWLDRYQKDGYLPSEEEMESLY